MERLSAQDLITLWPEQVGSPQDMGVVALIGAEQTPGAGLLIDDVRSSVARRIHLVPRLRQVVFTPPPGLGRPVWVDSPGFDIVQHVRQRVIPSPGTEAQLLATVEALRSQPLRLTRPLWEIWLLPGLAEARCALYVRVHHALADGSALISLVGAILDSTPITDVTPPRRWTPARAPTPRELLHDNVQSKKASLGRAAAAVTHPAACRPRAQAFARFVRSIGIAARAPRSSINRPIGSHRVFAVVRSPVTDLTMIAHAHSVTVNDVLLTAVAGGVGELLRSRGEEVSGLVLRAIVPIALPHTGQARHRGNFLGQMIVDLPVCETDRATRLRRIAMQTSEAKALARPRHVPVLRSRVLQRAAMRIAAHQRAYNIYVANLHGPGTPSYLAGAELLEVLPLVPLLGNLSLGVGALSYAGQFTIVAVGDTRTCPDVDVFARGLRSELRGWKE